MSGRRQTVTIGTRTSKLALWQTNHVVELLKAAWPGIECRTRTYVTEGDTRRDVPLPDMGGRGVFTTLLESALLTGEIDVAVHSLKDLPTDENPQLTVGAVPGREDARDGLVARNGETLAALPDGAVVGTSSTRRRAQLLSIRPDLSVREIRGNVDTRLRKVMQGDYDATVLAAAGLRRLGVEDAVSDWLPLDLVLPAPGQAALAVQCRRDDARVLEILGAIDDDEARQHVTAERTFLRRLGGGCSLPVAAHAVSGDSAAADAVIYMRGVVVSTDGRRVIRVEGRSEDAGELGDRLAEEALAQGAQDILDAFADDVPLRGKRIVVTRARRQARELSERLSRLGAVPILVPAIEIAPVADLRALDDAIRALDTFDWVVFTSANAVEVVWQRLEALGQADRGLGGARTAAVGPATAGALAERGVTVDLIPSEHVGEAVARALGDATGLRILLPRAEIAGGELPEALRANGAAVVDLPVYRTLAADIAAEQIAELKTADVITFTSGSTVRSFVREMEKHIERSAAGDRAAVAAIMERACIACIGPRTRETADGLGLTVHVTPGEYTSEGLVEALVEYFRKGR
ncbi:MAG: hydroxymethylbilane synthase [Candidatus Krumholzibacteriia bacterium]